ncbi:uncharacterized protein ycf36 [Carya illinoinensis]|uniref:Uncharacterized protein n=1 Tax=Carya illinoinensis TaxID=32201 RepID=A0A8T1N439_CARIL|nr:uncharacterized protein ycf36 [Carya illinoinensis]KAG6626316.1 hypothetical protein CIPAW_15G039200 [Carya illinoinensis]KAG6674382.1 hypothetical protein I3842_15G038300 [Carya illinoinensis]
MARFLHSSPKPPQLSFFFPSSSNFLSPIFSFPKLSLQHHHLYNFKSSISKTFASSFRNGRPETGCPVPLEQQPINEYQTLSTSFPFSWASSDIVEYSSKLLVTGASFALFIGLPVAWFGTVGPETEPFKRIICSVSSGILLVTLAVVRMYLGWAYVGNRLLSATVEYEETGWYDGQIWVKTAEVLARDRLLGSFSVKPVLSRLKFTLVVLAASLFACALFLTGIDGDQNVSNIRSGNASTRVIPGVYSDESARAFEPDEFCGEPGLP